MLRVLKQFILVYSLTVATVVVTVFGVGLVGAQPAVASFEGERIAQLSILDTVASSSGLTPEGYQYKDTALNVAIGKIINPFLGIFGSLFLVLVIYSGVVWMTAAGNVERIARAKRIMGWAALGLLIVVFAYGITLFIATQTSSSIGIVAE